MAMALCWLGGIGGDGECRKWDSFCLATLSSTMIEVSTPSPAVTLYYYTKNSLAVHNKEKHRLTMGGGHHHVTPGSEPRKDQDMQAIKDAKIPLAWRDTCSHILVGLNKCRRETWWNPNKCEHDRHIYEECEYNAYLQRVEAKVQVDKIKAAESD